MKIDQRIERQKRWIKEAKECLASNPVPNGIGYYASSYMEMIKHIRELERVLHKLEKNRGTNPKNSLRSARPIPRYTAEEDILREIRKLKEAADK